MHPYSYLMYKSSHNVFVSSECERVRTIVVLCLCVLPVDQLVGVLYILHSKKNIESCSICPQSEEIFLF